MVVSERMSDRHAKSDEDMMEVLAHDIWLLISTENKISVHA
jgi:hypothetical protein